MNKTELLAPAGGIKALKAAVQSGADAVYLGADRFSARHGADNFTLTELSKWVDYCHLRNTKVHLAANTLIKEREVHDFLCYIKEAYKAGIDAVIIQDIGMARRIKELIPELPLHASTQMTVSTYEGANALLKMGYDRVVLARELTKKEIANIRANTKAEIEVFVHGALCYSYSGQCLMSSIIGQRSGNRGMCAQPCRLPYEIVKDKRTKRSGYLLSPKDLCLREEISELVKLGIDSFKIEGRLKGAEYVAAAVSVYRKCIDGVTADENDIQSLTNAFNRSGFTKGWYGGGKDMMSGNSPSNVADGKISCDILEYTKDNANFRRRNVDIYADLKENNPLCVTMIDESGECVTVNGTQKAEKANKLPLTEERIAEQLNKLGGSVFRLSGCEVSLDEGITIPISEINLVRRMAADELLKKLIIKKTREIVVERVQKHERKEKQLHITAVCENAKQATVCLECGIECVAVKNDEIKKLSEKDSRLITLMPGVGIGEEPETDGVMVMNMAQAEKYSNKKLYAGFRFNITNSFSQDVFKNFETVTLSPELNLKDIKEMRDSVRCNVIAYGSLPLMIMRRCPAKDVCRGEGGYTLKDRRGEEFSIKCNTECVSELMNSKVIYMADKLDDIKKSGADAIELWFYRESPEEVKRIIDVYKKGINGEGTPCVKDFTRGHFYRGMV